MAISTLHAALAPAALVTFVLFGSPAAQEPASRPAASLPASGATDAATEIVTKSLKSLFDRTSLLFRGSAKKEAAERGGGMIVIAGGPGGEKFEGEFDAWITPGEIAVLAERDGIGFGIFETPAGRFCRETYSDAQPDISTFRNEALDLLNIGQLQKRLGKASWTRAEAGELVRFEASVDRKIIKNSKSAGPMPPMEKVIRVNCIVTTAKSGDVTQIAFHVMKTDPFAGMMRRMKKETGGGETEDVEMGGSIQFSAADLSREPSDSETGPVTTYTFDVVNGDPSAALVEFRKAMRDVAAKQDK